MSEEGDGADVFFETILNNINQIRIEQHSSELTDWSLIEFKCSSSIAKDVIVVKEDLRNENVPEDKARSLVLKKFLGRLGDEEENDLQLTVFARMATHLDAVFSVGDREACVEITVYFAYLELAKVSPVIDGALVVQGQLLSNEFGPALCVVSFAADDEEDFHPVVTIPPWDMILQRPEGEGSDEGDAEQGDGAFSFMIPIDIPEIVSMGDGLARVCVYVDRMGSIPFQEMDDSYDLTAAAYTNSLEWTTRCINHGHASGDATEAETELLGLPNGQSLGEIDTSGVAELSSAAIMEIASPDGYVLQDVSVANDYDDYMASKADGFVNCCETLRTENGEIEDDQQHVWKFYISCKYGPSGGKGVEDVLFLKIPKSLGHIPELKGYTVFHDVDLTDIDANYSCYLAVKYGPHPKFTKLTQVFCDSTSVVATNQLQSYLKANSCTFRSATEDIVEQMGGLCGIALQAPGLSLRSDSRSEGADLSSSEPSPQRSKLQKGASVDVGSGSGEHGKGLGQSQLRSFGSVLGEHGGRDRERERAADSDSDQDDDDINADKLQEIEFRLTQKLEELKAERSAEVAVNSDMQKRCILLIQKEKSLQIQNTPNTPAGKSGTPGNNNNPNNPNDIPPELMAEKEKQFGEVLKRIVDLRKKLRMQHEEFDVLAHDLQIRLDDKEFKCAEIMSSFKQFKKDVLSKAINSRSGKVISKRLIAQYEMVESKRETILEQVRLKNIAMRNLLRKLDKELRAREHLAEGLHMIDFEQLKIENQSLSEKIEERGEELIKLKRKKSTNVQLLSHVREKLVFIEKQNGRQKEELDEVEAQITEMRNALSLAKKEREATRLENKTLTQKQGFATNDLLIEDFQSTKSKIEDIQGNIRDLKNIYSVLARKMDLPVDTATGLVSSPIRSVSTSSLRVSISNESMNFPPFHTGFGDSPVKARAGENSGSYSNSSAGVLFSPVGKQRLTPMKGSPSAQLAQMRTMPAFPVSVMTPLRHNASTGSPYVQKLPPLSK